VSCGGTGSFGTISCSGTGSFNSITTTSLTTAGEVDTGNLTVGGTLAVGGYMGCACTANYYPPGTPYSSNTTTPLNWGAISAYGPQTISHTTNAAPFKVANAGFYIVMVNLTINSTGYTGGGVTALNIQYSADNSNGSYSNVVVAQQAYQFPGNQNIYCYGMLNMAANSYMQVAFYNNSGATVGFINTAGYSTIQFARVA
jgi:hypothetical protein